MGLFARLARAFQAAKTTEHYTPPRAANFSPDGAVQDAGEHLRAWGRHFEENHDIAVGILDELVNQIVGRGIQIEPMVIGRDGRPLEAVNQALADLIEEWAEFADVTRELTWAEAQRLTCRAWLRDGDHFTHHIQGYDRGYVFEPGRIPYALELVEADRVPLDFTIHASAPKIFQGVELDGWHRPIAFHVYEEHPGSNTVRFSPTATGAFLARTKRVPASQMSQLAWRRRFPQVRGVSIFAPVTRRLHDIHDYDESERIAARVNARLAMWVKRDPEATQPAQASGTERTIELPQGAVMDELGPGEDIGTASTERPNASLNEHRQGQLRAVAAGTYTRYSAIGRDFNGTYSAQRQELVEARHGYRPLTEFFVSRVVRAQYMRLIETALLIGRLDARIAQGMSIRELARAEYIGPEMPWIDPGKEIDADVKAIDNDLQTREQVIRRRGGDPRKVPQRERPREQQATPTPAPQDQNAQ